MYVPGGESGWIRCGWEAAGEERAIPNSQASKLHVYASFFSVSVPLASIELGVRISTRQQLACLFRYSVGLHYTHPSKLDPDIENGPAGRVANHKTGSLSIEGVHLFRSARFDLVSRLTLFLRLRPVSSVLLPTGHRPSLLVFLFSYSSSTTFRLRSRQHWLAV